MAIIRKAVSSQLCSIVEWTDSTSNTIVYRFPMDGRKIMLGSSLTVREGQTAIFVNKGQVADVFTPGMYKLDTSNIPLLSAMLGIKYGFKSPFQAEVYFVNTKQFTNQKWGTSNPITMRDAEFGTIRIRGFGTYSFRVQEAFTLMKELFGTNSTFKVEDITGMLRSEIVSAVSEVLASSKMSAIDLTSKLRTFEKTVKEELDEGFLALGLRLVNFNIENISFPEEIEKALDTRASMGVMGDKMGTFTQYQAAHAMREAASNPNGNAGMGMSVGAGMAMAGMMTEQMKQMGASKDVPAAETSTKVACTKCKTQNSSSAKFCKECGTKMEQTAFCAECGVKLTPGAKFCPQCGKKQ